MTKRNVILPVLIIFFMNACDDHKSQPAAADARIQAYGTVDGKAVYQYVLKNASGMEVRILNYGGTVTDIIVPDKEGKPANVVLSYDSLAGYEQKGNPYFGCLVGRYANRIAGATFTLDGIKYSLAANNNGNSLHGGLKGFDKVVWDVASFNGDTSITFTHLSPDGDEGYPGNLNVTVTYSLSGDNALSIDYTATTDKTTPLNLSNHCYFNLSGGKDSTVLDHEIQLNAGAYTEVNDQLIPTGRSPMVSGGPMDFTKPKRIGQDIDKVAGGYDHNWVLDQNEKGLRQVALLRHPASGRRMEVFTTQPGIQFYTGNFLDGTLMYTRNRLKYIRHAGLCLETQHFPDGPNQPAFPNTLLRPGETFHETTLYRFGVGE